MLTLHSEGLGYASFMNNRIDITIIEHINYEGELINNGVRYQFFKAKKGFFYLYRQTIRYIKKERPDILYVQGLVFPFQVILLRVFLGKKYTIVVQHHGGGPFSGIKKIFQRIADKCIDAYVFTAIGNVAPWKASGIIKKDARCFEILEGSTDFKQQDKLLSREKINISGDPLILWVGRLNKNKDPLTVLEGFKKYVQQVPGVRLYMIYQEDDLLDEIKKYIAEDKSLQDSVYLQGKVSHEELPYWFSAADLFVSGSHSEGSGYALLEAMACGCIPVVTAIPSFKKITIYGEYGYLFEPGNDESLYTALIKAGATDKEDLSKKITAHFAKELSFNSIAEKLYRLCIKLTAK